MSSTPVKVTLYRWAGAWGPFKVNIPCGECSLTVDVIEETFANELADIPVKLETHDWLSEWWRPLKSGGWHAPIVIVGKRLVSQGHALNRGLLTVPQIWFDGKYVGGADELQEIIKNPVEANPDRGRNSLSRAGKV